MTRLADILHSGDPIVDGAGSAAQTGWLGALQDKQIGRALALVHRDPSHPWTVESLANEVAMSRYAFTARFTSIVGEPVMHYVARWRMNVALTWLKADNVPLAEVAGRLGYESEAAFRRTFKRVIGFSPGAVRRTTAATPHDSLPPSRSSRRPR